MADLKYHLWSNKHNSWWKSGAWGYTTDAFEAGEFTEAEAIRHVVASAQAGMVQQASVMIVVWPSPTEEPEQSGPAASEAHEHGYKFRDGLGYLAKDPECTGCCAAATKAYREDPYRSELVVPVEPVTDAAQVSAAIDDKAAEAAGEDA